MHTSPPPSRRNVLRYTAVGAITIVGLRVGDAASAAVSTLPSSSARMAQTSSTSCATLTPELTQGPFWVDERLNRSTITADSETGAVQSGIPLTLTLNLQDVGASCSPQVGAYVDIWHANAQGAYSDVSGSGNPDNVGVDWLRGYQVSDTAGSVTFTTIVPGWYVSRTLHIHLRVRVSLDDTTSLDFTSQLFFTEAMTQAVVATSDYAKSGTRTTNTTDQLYDASLLLDTSGKTSAGYAAAFTIGLDFGDGVDDTGDTAGTTTSDEAVSARILSVAVVRRGGRRRVHVRLRNREKVTGRIQLLRHDDVLAHKRLGWLSPGRRTLQLRVPRRWPAGPAKIRFKVTDAAGNTRILTKRITLPG